MHNYSNSQTEYKSIFSPFDAETVQGRQRLNPTTGEGLHRINAMINHHLKGKGQLNPHNAVVDLKYKLNHMNLDFPFTSNQPLEMGINVFEVNHGNVFGATPTTDLTKGFDHGADLPTYRLTIAMGKDENGFNLTGKLEPQNAQIAEAFENSVKKKKRISNVKNMIKQKKM